ncbi:2-dehydro-3-deoxyphosphooctonate aldolase [Flavobacterium sp. RHBU_24]|uniref:2-dehydro-3-deoxyphosphooctonate aldolase n=1 Tax=Flavobacterium sp. RHBU_24 TaxID=3391185 RepID=UPI0039853A30
MKKLLAIASLVLLASCVSTKNTIKNIDDSAAMPALTKDNNFTITEISSDKHYGYDQDYPVNLGFLPAKMGDMNVKRYFGALTGPNGEAITYTKTESCCPFPTKNDAMGAGLLDIYEVSWNGLGKPKIIYINIYEKGAVKAPAGFGIKK